MCRVGKPDWITAVRLHQQTSKIEKEIDQLEGGGGGVGFSQIKVGTDVWARVLGFSGVNFCQGIRIWEVNFARALGFWQFLTKSV